MLQDSFNTPQSLDDISPIVIQVPQLPIMPLVRPPEGILFQNLILLEICPYPPSFIICKGVSVLLEQSIDSRYPAIPRILPIKFQEYYVVSDKRKHMPLYTMVIISEEIS